MSVTSAPVDTPLTLRPARWAVYAESRPLRFSPSQLRYDPLNPRPSPETERRFWELEVEAGTFRIWEIQHRDHGLLGFLYAFHFKDGDCETGVGILPERFWGEGFAREAYVLLLGLLKGEGLHTTHIFTHVDNERALRLFRRLGYVLDGYVVDEGVSMVRYRLDLGDL